MSAGRDWHRRSALRPSLYEPSNPNMKTAAFIFGVLLSTAVSVQAQKPATGYAPVNGLGMYYEIHGGDRGEPLVLLHGSFMTISNVPHQGR